MKTHIPFASLFSDSAAAILLVVGLYATSATAQLTLNTSFNAGISDGDSSVTVTAVQPDGKILVGGNFAFANGAEKFGLVRLNSNGSLDATFNPGGVGPNAVVYEVKVLGDGKIIIGGGFGTYNGTAIQGLARLNSDGTLDTTFNVGGIGVQGAVQGISIQTDGKYILTGGMSAYNGTAKFSVIRINTDGTLDTTFTSPFVNQVFVEQSGLQTDGKIIIGGQFNAGPYNNFARLTTTGALDGTFNGGGTISNGAIFQTHVLADNKILLGGPFGAINGSPRPGLARLNADGTVDNTFNPVATDFYNPEYVAVKPNGQYVYAGNLSNNTGDYPIALVNTDGSLDGTFGRPQADNIGYQVTLQPDGKILLAGYFNNVEVLDGLLHRNLVRLNTNGTVDATFVTPFSTFGSVGAMLQQSDGKYVVAGNFNAANGATHRSVARFNVDGTIDPSFDSGYGIWGKGTFNAFALAAQADGKILMGGNFWEYNLNDARSLVRLNTNGTQDGTFNPIGISAGNPAVNDLLVLPDGKIMVGGSGLDIGIQALVRLNANGSGDPTFAIGNSNGPVQKILRQSDGKLILFGNFTSYLGGARNRIVRVNADGTLDSTFTPGTGANNSIFTAAFQADGKILIGGVFTSYNGTTRNRIARLNSDGSLDSTFNPVSGANGTVVAIAIQPDGKIVIGGPFTTYDGVSRIRLARLNSDGTLDSSANSGIENNFRFGLRRLMLTADNQILVGGTFVTYNGVARNSIAKLRLSSGVPFDYDGDGKADISVYRPSGGSWWIRNSLNGSMYALEWGSGADRMAPADYDGDGQTDVAIFRPGTGQWWVLNSQTMTLTVHEWGIATDVVAPGDYTGDGKADYVVWRPSDGNWWIRDISNGQVQVINWGISTDKPVQADYDGDGKTDIAVFRPADGVWWVIGSQTGGVSARQWGDANDKLVPADYTGDGKAEFAVWRPSEGNWWVLNPQTGTFSVTNWGIPTDIPAPADYDGNGKTDLAVFRPAEGNWWIYYDNNSTTAIGWGTNGDQPTPNAYVR